MINIIEGFSKSLLSSMGFIEIPTYAMERIKVCEGCEENKEGICQECGCFLHAKTLVKREKCGLDKWEHQ